MLDQNIKYLKKPENTLMPLSLLLRARNLLDAARLAAVRSITTSRELLTNITRRLTTPATSETAFAMVRANEALILAEARKETQAVRSIADRLAMFAKAATENAHRLAANSTATELERAAAIELSAQVESLAQLAARSATNAEAEFAVIEELAFSERMHINLSVAGGAGLVVSEQEAEALESDQEVLASEPMTWGKIRDSVYTMDPTGVDIGQAFIDVYNPYLPADTKLTNLTAAVVDTVMIGTCADAVDNLLIDPVYDTVNSFIPDEPKKIDTTQDDEQSINKELKGKNMDTVWKKAAAPVSPENDVCESMDVSREPLTSSQVSSAPMISVG